MRKNKKVILMVLCMLTVFVIGGCSKDSEKESTDISTENVEGTENEGKTKDAGSTEDAEAVEGSYEDAYKEILDKYYVAMNEKWDMQQVSEASLNYMSVYMKSEKGDFLVGTGYYISDIDGNGIPELLIGNTEDNEFFKNTVFEVYTLVDNQPEIILSGEDRCIYYLCDDGKFINQISGGPASTSCYILEIGEDGKTLNAVEGVRTDIPDLNDSSTINWYFTNDLDYDCTNDELITEDEANQNIERYTNMHISVPFISFTEYQYSK